MEPRRARTVDELAAKMELFTSPAGQAHADAFVPRPTDVVISPDSKAGTTFLQQIAHGIRTGGSMAFEEISSVVPWTMTAHDVGIDLDDEQVGAPRLFKSHDGAGLVPQGARYIVAFRDPLTRIVSLYRFLGDWFFDTDAISLDDFAMMRLPPPGDPSGYWHKLVSWWQRRHEIDAVFFAFEDMTDDVAGTVDRVARFLDVDLDASTRELVIHQASREFMLEHVSQFDDHLLVQRFVDRGVLPPGEATGKVTSGPPASLELSERVKGAYRQAWAERVTPVIGFPDYRAFRDSLSS